MVKSPTTLTAALQQIATLITERDDLADKLRQAEEVIESGRDALNAYDELFDSPEDGAALLSELHGVIDDLAAQVAANNATRIAGKSPSASSTSEGDPWHAKIIAYLATRHDVDLWMTSQLLDCCGVSKQNPGHARRLAKVMRQIGGWTPSGNVPNGVGDYRVRGYLRKTK